MNGRRGPLVFRLRVVVLSSTVVGFSTALLVVLSTAVEVVDVFFLVVSAGVDVVVTTVVDAGSLDVVVSGSSYLICP